MDCPCEIHYYCRFVDRYCRFNDGSRDVISVVAYRNVAARCRHTKATSCCPKLVAVLAVMGTKRISGVVRSVGCALLGRKAVSRLDRVDDAPIATVIAVIALAVATKVLAAIIAGKEAVIAFLEIEGVLRASTPDPQRVVGPPNALLGVVVQAHRMTTRVVGP